MEIRDAFLAFHVFGSPKETVHYIIQSYETYLGIESLEEDLGLTKNEFLKIAGKDIYQNDFMKRIFREALTNRMKIFF